MRIALFTSNHLRHKYIASHIANALSLELIVTEEKSPVIEDTKSYNLDDSLLLAEHFRKRNLSEIYFFGAYGEFPKGVEVVSMDHGSINSEETLILLRDRKIDAILLFGTSIIKSNILREFPENVVNLHLGLSPYYKGSGTNFFPIMNNEFECLGATIHVATNKVDAGAILHQLRPETISVDDDIHSLGNKVIVKAGLLYPKVIKAYLSGVLEGVVQPNDENSKEFRIKDFTPEALRKANNVLLEGGIASYLANQERRLASKSIISNFNE